jgi:hypothetical protein
MFLDVFSFLFSWHAHVSLFFFPFPSLFICFSRFVLVVTLEKSQDRMMKELHSYGKTMEDIAEVLKRIPIHPQVISAIKAAHALG